ncbi:MAG: aminoglycoside phosphotransferase family protein [Deltaproteobacteria bacterium]|nr:aminoglycoside phosphotransferase family protein [Deltaproteobacteria bacterium]
MDLMAEMLPKVSEYLASRDWNGVPVMQGRKFKVTPLAQGEYNLNYLIASDSIRLVLRVNIGTQIDRDDQIVYEYRALDLLRQSRVTPKPYFVDDTRCFFDRGILIMDYLPGEALDYNRDLAQAAGLFAKIHQIDVPPEKNQLIREDAPLSLIFEECAGLLQQYFDSDLADPDIRQYLIDLKNWADMARANEKFYQQDPWPCIVNTEVNSGNFIVNRGKGMIHLVDWEMPRWGDPSQDLSHFCSPLTTLWKTDWRMSPEIKRDFLNTYRRHITDSHLRNTLEERVRLRDPFVYLRGISWSAMGWVAYQTEFSGMKNPDTWAKLQQYLNLKFIRSLFNPLIKVA